MKIAKHPPQLIHIMPRAAKVFVHFLKNIQHGELRLIFPDGTEQIFAGKHAGVSAVLKLDDIAVCEAILARGDIGFGETYMRGMWHSPDIAKLIHLAVNNRNELSTLIGGKAFLVVWYRLKHLLRRNSLAGSRKNILAHYDLGNEFYAHWLDSGMTYSAALFEQENSHSPESQQSLEHAQDKKYLRIAEKLALKKGAHVLEIGCGWGGFAQTAIEKFGATVEGVTLSPSQLHYAQKRLQKLNLDHYAKLTLTDYRAIQGRYDYIVSIEMFEAVGEDYWATYFAALKRLLNKNGRAMIQTITIADAQFESYRKGTDFIQQYIFPGGMLPSVVRFTELADAAGLRVVERHAFGLDYARTLKLWRERFEEKWHEISPLGFDERFRRLWKFYLAYCEGGFRAGATDVYQFELRHA